MTRTDQRQETAPDPVSALPRSISTSPSTSLRPTADPISDNDNGEKPVREKLKKTSLASMSSHIVGRQERALKANEESFAPGHMHRDTSPEKESNRKRIEPRGRPVRKRSFDDLDTPEAEGKGLEGGIDHAAKPNANGHLRKRSRDVRVGEIPKENRRPLLAETPMQEESEDPANGVETSEAWISETQNAVDSTSPAAETLSQVEMEQDKQTQDLNEPIQNVSGILQRDSVTETEKDSADQEMRDTASSPRKKRSRDQFDTDADREQKIPATEEARAHRRSDELERDEGSVLRNRSPVSQESSGVAEKEPVIEEEKKGFVDAHVGVEKQERPFGSAFGNASTSMAFTRSGFPVELPTFTTKATDQEFQASSDAFASSGFATLAGSSTSPFGTLGGSLTAASASPFASAGTFNLAKKAQKTETSANGGFGAFVKSSSTGVGTTDQSPFGTSVSSETGVFGGSVFGSAFGGPFSRENRLTSFAAPTGNAKLGTVNGAIKPIGSPTRDGDEDENSDSDGEVLAENKKDEEPEEADGRFQHQDVETGEGGEDSIFSSRASLYSFRDNAWKESGKGIFKLNIAAASSEDASSDQKTGRFIMRAHQTFRVLLNVPVFKKMQVGDSKGNEPFGKSFLFAVIEDRPIPHMIKLGDVTESKTLYHEVQRLQKGLE